MRFALLLLLLLAPILLHAQDPVPPYPHPTPAWWAKEKALDRKKTLDFSGEALEDVLALISKETGLPIKLDAPDRDPDELRVHLRVEKLALRSSVRLILELKQLKMVPTARGMVVTDRANELAIPQGIQVALAIRRARGRVGEKAPVKPAALSDAQVMAQAKLGEKKLTVDFQDTPIEDVLQFVSQVTKTSLVVDQDAKTLLAKGPGTITIKRKDAPASEVLLAVLKKAALAATWRPKHKLLMITTRAAKVSRQEMALVHWVKADERWKAIRALRAKDLGKSAQMLAVHALPGLLGKALGVPVHVDEASWQIMPTVPLGDWRTLDQLEQPLRQLGVRLHVEPGAIYLFR